MSRSAGRVARLFAEASISQLWQPGVCQTIARSCPTISYQTMPFSFTLRHTLAAQEPQDEDDAGRRGSRKPNFSIADQIAIRTPDLITSEAVIIFTIRFKFDFDSTAIRPPLYSNSTAIRPRCNHSTKIGERGCG